MFNVSSIFLPFLVAFIATTLFTPVAIYFFKKLKIVDDPKRKHPGIIHKIPIPRGGGIPLFLGVLVASIIFLPLTNTVILVLLAAGIALIAGILDDKYDISPYKRFLINILCAVIVVSAGISVPYITNPLGGILHLNEIFLPFDVLGIQGKIVLSDLIAVIWIIWVMNMLNWSKGVDGQMPGIVAISAIVIGILSLRFPLNDEASVISASLSFILAGSALGFLIFNFHPAKIFPGYSATAIYLLLSVVSMLSSAKLATAILVMGVPLADGLFTITRRISTGKSPFWHDKKHLHHLLLSLGLGQRRIALFYWSLSAILGALSFTLSSKGKLFAIIMVGILVGGAILFLNLLLRYKNGKNSVQSS
ncbi:MAG: undecaprenyl/decaprenyl-phosphate alpha-N-acetylglucosaminyl 1-phosphate transferase [Candidatus Levybacteria bacterium]|nr:undecaprenyl/decaprenyl-phosphate alpha-N-acetylglucosaminyl 1-phosphate transferase [Candidatus Levybacteria bacterium]MBI2421020.1 undecaprenyl/decaprenyl-phosphate alpha-N-acetylglucosaminyl 1-phosphate transferase [Candidatus Levybacteria bacterium]